jgi:hypothetical protein
MARKLTDRIVRAITGPLWQRDDLQMRAADALLSAIETMRRRGRRRARDTRRRRARKSAQ